MTDRTSSWYLPLLMALTLAALSPLVAAQKGPQFVASSKLAKSLDELADRCVTVGFTGAILLAKDGKVLLARGDGHADENNDAETLFEVASLSKQFTAAAILRLAELKKLDLDDSIAKHLPDIPKDCEKITIRHLLQHTSGIPGSNSQGHGDKLEVVIPQFLRGGPQHKPGTHWDYWNQGYALLSGIIELKSRTSISEFSTEQLFKKAKMRTACFTGDACPKDAKQALGRSERGDRLALAHPYGAFGYQYRGMGGAVCSLWDLWAWDRALHGKKVLKKESVEELFKPGLENYALGWRVEKKGQRLVQSHTGSVRGFLADMRRYADDDGCLVLLLNDDRQALHQISNLFERALFEESFVAPPPPLEAERKSSLAGLYLADDGTKLELVEGRGALLAKLTWNGQPRPMEAYIGQGKSEKALSFFDWQRLGSLVIESEENERVQELRLDGRTLFKRQP